MTEHSTSWLIFVGTLHMEDWVLHLSLWPIDTLLDGEPLVFRVLSVTPAFNWAWHAYADTCRWLCKFTSPEINGFLGRAHYYKSLRNLGFALPKF